MKKIIVFSYYFGKLPEWFPFFLKSTEYNSTIDFVIVTDDRTKYEWPSNTKAIYTSFEDAQVQFQKLFPEFRIVLNRPYKLCDYKPVWGFAFPELLKDYDFWGYCDLDMFFGDIRSFVTDEVLENFDKVYQFGHLTLYRNSKINNSRYKLRADNAVFYQDAFTTTEIVAFDEIAGIQNIFDSYKIPTYKSRDFADISWNRVRFTLTDFHVDPIEIPHNNYDKQLFYWDHGRVFRAYLDNGEIKSDEFVYIHFSKRAMTINNLSPDCSSFHITNRGLFEKKENITVNDFDVFNPTEPKKEKKRSREVQKNIRREKAKYYWGIAKRKLGISKKRK